MWLWTFSSFELSGAFGWVAEFDTDEAKIAQRGGVHALRWVLKLWLYLWNKRQSRYQWCLRPHLRQAVILKLVERNTTQRNNRTGVTMGWPPSPPPIYVNACNINRKIWSCCVTWQHGLPCVTMDHIHVPLNLDMDQEFTSCYVKCKKKLRLWKSVHYNVLYNCTWRTD